MSCACAEHFDQQLLGHIIFHQNAEAKLMLNENLAKVSNCRGTLLYHAILVSNDDVARHLIDLGSPIDSPGPGAKTPLMTAVEFDRKVTVRFLLEAGADINIVDARGESALYKALHSAIHFEVVEAILLRARAETPVTEELIERLLAAGCPFPYFVLLRDIDVLENLLLRGLDVNERTCENETALHLAVLIRDFESAKLLVARGADVNAANSWPIGPLYYAARGADPGMVRLLLDHGANPAPYIQVIDHSPLFACFMVGKNEEEQVRECAELLLVRGIFPLQPRSFVKQLEFGSKPILRTSRLNCLVANQAALDAYRVPSCEEAEHLTTFVELRGYYDKCREILEVEVVGGMTVLRVLDLSSIRELRLRARDQAFVHQVEQFCAGPFKETFPFYARLMKKQIAKAARTVELEKRGILVVCRLFNCHYNQLSIFARQVVGHLSESDLEQLCRV